jgi:hypothetical protein
MICLRFASHRKENNDRLNLLFCPLQSRHTAAIVYKLSVVVGNSFGRVLIKTEVQQTVQKSTVWLEFIQWNTALLTLVKSAYQINPL